ncbi:LPS assembly lipoprotein LptE [Pseudoalteromonas aurantia]|jgi:LPS-assembly lipoprotein|uniref:LPS-assembly lipoprotein LptE n=1 Tax=Pseudoalteromonas aurantia TaxID=43654 RepID=A0A5S3VDP1_9GAMM|nr:LPS assembly lipoprotein LptE [Pseudoalteromonas aurantia]TMO64500.1 hypothetical protein CWC18_06390 [Pseudoalteromonas aurantia]TMO70432.1 hypothetical protein CWC19_01030 [Pseudoalteromonas aurantia]TMO77701.1 hypothetical protein CWC20_03700 [Pseudoalteromonas aurantia]
MRFAHFVKHGAALALFCVLLSSCGFHLKKASYLPDDLRTITLTADNPRSEVYELLKSDLERAQVALLPTNSSSQHTALHLYKDTLERQTLSLFKNGQVAQYELAYAVTYRVSRPGKEPVEQGFELYRNYQDDPDNALAKAKELDIILRELRQLASKRIVRELSQL